ncbi:dsDNA nuclease domain-containing protein [Lactococcus lactis]|uniref:CD-NTase associated protein 4-like DNA endonuclease domain-containing protein n=1 Tax=Lactococcus lactis TaxID=1358 RepID=A0A6M0MB03_9LACT|nr:hypothetical protein [Lactococcus lactis]NEX49371.1 hypothetical protein [Lactococcus lactis]NEX56452.1 hypothetical protein [Lactococcus lactis]
MMEDFLINKKNCLSHEEVENIKKIDFSSSPYEIKSPSSNEDLEDIGKELCDYPTSDDGGIIAMTGFYYQMMVSVHYLGEVFQGKWDGIFLDHHQDIVLFNNSKKVVKFIQVKTTNKNFSGYDSNISKKWIPKLFKSAYDIPKLNEFTLQFEIISNCFYSDGTNYKLSPFYSGDNKEFKKNLVLSTSSEEFKNMIHSTFKKLKYNSVDNFTRLKINKNRIFDLNKTLNQKIENYFENLKIKYLTPKELISQIKTTIPQVLGFENSQLSYSVINNIISEFFKACYNPKDPTIQLIAGESLNELKDYTKKQLTNDVTSAYHRMSDEKVLTEYFTYLDEMYSNSNKKLNVQFLQEFKSFADIYREDLENILSSSNLSMVDIINQYLKKDRYIEVNEAKRSTHFKNLLSLLLFLKISFPQKLEIEDKNRHILSFKLNDQTFLVFGNSEIDSLIDEIINEFKDSFIRLGNAEKLRIMSSNNIALIISGLFDDRDIDDSKKLERTELDFSTNVQNINEKLDDINTSNITNVQTDISILYSSQTRLESITRSKRDYTSIQVMKEKIRKELKLGGLTKNTEIEN